MISNKLHRWYEEVLSGFTQAQQKGEIGKNDLEVINGNKKITISVPIMEPKNMGERMAIDEKTIDRVYCTLLSNKDISKTALMAATLKSDYLMKLMQSFDFE